MIVVIFLPQPHTGFLLIRKSCFLFKAFCQDGQFAGWSLTKHQEMQMVGHDAIRVHKKLVKVRFASQHLNNPCGFRGVEENGIAILAAHRNEGPFLSEVFPRVQSVCFAGKIHFEKIPCALALSSAVYTQPDARLKAGATRRAGT
jgi:hypothetical protein